MAKESACERQLITPKERAISTGGRSEQAVYRAVQRVIDTRAPDKKMLIDIGCGRGDLLQFLGSSFTSVGVDIHHYDGFPATSQFIEAELNTPPFPIESTTADLVVSAETIEHLENPRAFFRELFRIAKPGGLIIVTTPNQLSLLSKTTLVLKNQFNAFQNASYPAHITALLEIDLVRIASETGLVDIEVSYTNCGRVPFSARHWPAGFGGRRFSDNLLISAFRP